MKDPIVRRLLENRQTIDTSLLSAKNGSDEAYDLMDILEAALRSARAKLFDDVDIDDSGMNSYGDINGERTIVYQAQVYHSQMKNGKPIEVPLSEKEKKSLYNELSNNINLPPEDDKYTYQSILRYEGTTMKITLKREF